MKQKQLQDDVTKIKIQVHIVNKQNKIVTNKNKRQHNSQFIHNRKLLKDVDLFPTEHK